MPVTAVAAPSAPVTLQATHVAVREGEGEGASGGAEATGAGASTDATAGVAVGNSSMTTGWSPAATSRNRSCEGWPSFVAATFRCPRETRTGCAKRRGTDGFVVDEDLGAIDVGPDLDHADAVLERPHVGLDRRRRRGGMSDAALSEERLQRRQRVGVALELVVRLPEVIENAIVGREVVGALELDERAVPVALLVELDPPAKVGRGLGHRVARG